MTLRPYSEIGNVFWRIADVSSEAMECLEKFGFSLKKAINTAVKDKPAKQKEKYTMSFDEMMAAC